MIDARLPRPWRFGPDSLGVIRVHGTCSPALVSDHAAVLSFVYAHTCMSMQASFPTAVDIITLHFI
ncbi:hypothetical protein BDV12DRAFT_166808 [Aspergillus spectabilis]